MNDVKIGTFINDILKILKESYKSFENYRIDFENEDFQNNKIQLNPTTIYKIIKYNTKPSESSLDIIKNFIIEKSTNQTKKGITTNKNGEKIIEYCSNFINNTNKSNFTDIINNSFNNVIKNSEIQESSSFKLEGEPIKPLNLKDKFKKKDYDEKENFNTLKTHLFNGSIKLYNTFFSENGRFENLKIDNSIIPNVELKIKDIESIPLKQAIQMLRFSKSWHCILTGYNLSGKTISLLNIWKSYLSDLDYPIPIYIDLKEYDLIKEKKHFIIEKIISDYLDIPKPIKKDINRLWQFSRNSKYKTPSLILLLDGFNEITTNKDYLIYELHNIIEKLKGIQIIITSSYNFTYYLSWKNFNLLKLLNLDNSKISNYLNDNNIDFPKDKKITNLIKYPIFLTIYSKKNDIINRNLYNPLFTWKENISFYNLLFNYVELSISKKFESTLSIEKTLLYSFIIKFLLPYISHKMKKLNTYELSKEQFFKITNESIDNIYYSNFIEKYDNYAETLKSLIVKKNLLNLKIRFKKIENILTTEMSYMSSKNKIYKFNLDYLRNYFSNLHTDNILKYTSNFENEKFKL